MSDNDILDGLMYLPLVLASALGMFAVALSW